MKQYHYRKQDYLFGQKVLSLRTTIGLTQTTLAGQIGVSRRTIGSWEAGSKYPKTHHLKQFILLALKHSAFPAGSEHEAIHALWQAARQKVLLDEVWLAGVLETNHNQTAVSPAAENPTIEAPNVLSNHGRPGSGSNGLPLYALVDWGDSLAVDSFYGREWELNLLTEWVIDQRCRVITVLGMGGIGKSSLSVVLMRQLASRFDFVIWRSLRDLPNCDWLLNDLLQKLNPQPYQYGSASFEERMGSLMEELRRARILLVIDNVETALEEGENAGRMLHDFEGFGRFLRYCAETDHQSCILLTSREKPAELIPFEGSRSPVRVLRLSRLDAEACAEILAEKEVVGSAGEKARLIEAYGGNPLALKIVAQTIVELFDGEIVPFLEQGEIIFGNIRDLLAEQFERLAAVERCVLMWLAILREPATLLELDKLLISPIPRIRLLEAIEALRRRSLIEPGQSKGSFALHPVIMEYVTNRLITEMSAEIQEGSLAHLIEHGIELAQARTYIQETQERLILNPILVHLRSYFHSSAGLVEQIKVLLTDLSKLADEAQGYGPANLVALLRCQQGHLRGLDLSGLSLRSVYLQGVDMQDATLQGAFIQSCVFSETFDAVTAVAVSSTGSYWAAASARGDVRVWLGGGQTLHRMWTAHTDMVWTLAFSPEGNLLASGSWDGQVKLWDVANGSLIWAGRHASHINHVSFSPNGHLLASCGNDAAVRLWDSHSGQERQLLPHPKQVTAAAWSPDGRTLASGDLSGTLRFWELPEGNPAICRQTLAAHANWIDGLAFSPNGQLLASASWDGTVKLWHSPIWHVDIGQIGLAEPEASGRIYQTLTGHRDQVSRVAWSQDGRTLASSSRDQTIWLWEVEQRSYRMVLQGHAASIKGLAFLPDGRGLFSGSVDGSLRVWDTTSGQCIHIIQGYVASLYDVDWNPDGTQLVSGGSDTAVSIYSAAGEWLPRVLHGHTNFVLGVGWSATNRWVASSEWNNIIRLWDPASGECLHILNHPDDTDNYFYRLAWSPDGQRLACGTNKHGICVIELAANGRPWTRSEFPTWIREVAWHPNGTLLAGGGDDGVVYLWDADQKTVRQQCARHRGMITSLAFSPDGRWLASSSSDNEGEVVVWDLLSGQQANSLVSHSGIVYALAWGLEAETLVSAGDDGALRWWDVRQGECLRVREAHQGTVQSLKRSPDGTKLASCGEDGAIKLWDSHSGEHLQTLRRDRPYERLNITGIRGLTEARKATLRALGAVLNAPG